MWRVWRRTDKWKHLHRLCSPLLRRQLPHRLLTGSANDARTVPPYMEVSHEVTDAVATGRPVVALETTLVTHGMPYPENIQTALEVEKIVRSHNVVPATVGILGGRICVGMSVSQLTQLAELSRLGGVVKVSRRDLAHTLSQGMSGGTTVAATMMCADRAGVRVFVTGGLGGVHREGEKTLDVSADIMELGRTPVAVVCAGVKSILDIGRTLEVLETQGVAVATFGDSKEFPAFFTRTSGFEAPLNVESPTSAAKLIDTSLTLGIGSGVVIAVPIPDECSVEGSEIETAIQQALLEADSAGIEGKEVTPYILKRVNELTGGKSLQANISLIKHNAHVGSCIASELAKLHSVAKEHSDPSNTQEPEVSSDRASFWTSQPSDAEPLPPKTPVVIGASIFDFVAKFTASEIKSEGTNPGSLHQVSGGVARNIAGTTPFFISALGDDANGRSLGRGLKDIGMSLSGIHLSPSLPTAVYCVILNSCGEVIYGLADMDIHTSITPEWVRKFESQLKDASIVCVDGNISVETLQYVCDVCHSNQVPVWFEPTGVDKAGKLVHKGVLGKIHYVSPNLSELRSIHESLYGAQTSRKSITDLSLQQKLSECSVLVPGLLDNVPHVLATLGRDGVVWGRKEGGRYAMSHFSTMGHPIHNQPVSVSGAGDSFVGGMVSCLSQGHNHELSIKAGLRAANLSVLTMLTVSPHIDPQEEALHDWAPWEPLEVTPTV